MPFVSDRRLPDLVNVSAATKAARAMTAKAGQNLHDDVVKYTPVYKPHPLDGPRKRKPGTAKRSIRKGRVEPYVGGGGRGYRITVYTDDPIFPHIEWSTRPHPIRPKKNRPNASLRFAIGAPGRVVFAKEVQHPGTRGQHPFARGAATLAAKVPRIFAPELLQFERDLVARRPTGLRDAA